MQNSRRKFVTGSVAGAILVTVFARRFNFAILRNVVRDTTKITAMMMFILMAAQVFALSFWDFRAKRWLRTCSAGCRAAKIRQSSSCCS